MNIRETWKKFQRWWGTRKCVRAGHPWYPEDGPLPYECPTCVIETVSKRRNKIMKRFVVRLKGSVGMATIPIPSAVEVAEGFDVTWLDEPEASPTMRQHGVVDEEKFVLLQHKFEDTGFYFMFDDTPVHTH